MSDVSWDSSEDLEAPTDDAVEQHQPVPGEGAEPAGAVPFELPDEADVADAADQYLEVSDDEDTYR
jgi:hypothetical protein